jgi:NAD(P)-dependent dehydrogenase (short-subunit alcohol dehydrogenase family)
LGPENQLGDMLRDKVVVITGAGSGIGREMALLMAAHGAKVVVNDVGHKEGESLSAAEMVVQTITERGGRAVASKDSVASQESASRIVQAALDSFGRIDRANSQSHLQAGRHPRPGIHPAANGQVS